MKYIKNKLFIERVSVQKVANRFGTPAYCYSYSKLKDNINNFKKNFKSFSPLICFSVKSNTNLNLIREIKKFGLGADVVSKGELQKCIENGIMPEKIVFSGVGKTKDEITYALKKSIKQLNVESEEELEEISEIAKGERKNVNICVRVNPDVDPRTHYKISTGRSEDKFGIPNSRITKLFEKYKNNKHLKIVGLSIHIGSQIQSLRPFEIAFKKIKKQIN